jgi:hypothetical protein
LMPTLPASSCMACPIRVDPTVDRFILSLHTLNPYSQSEVLRK